jgi:hypothetical protein
MKVFYKITSEETGTVILKKRKIAKAMSILSSMFIL